MPHAKMEECGVKAIAGKLPLTEETEKLIPENVFKGIGLIFAPMGYFTRILKK